MGTNPNVGNTVDKTTEETVTSITNTHIKFLRKLRKTGLKECFKALKIFLEFDAHISGSH